MTKKNNKDDNRCKDCLASLKTERDASISKLQSTIAANENMILSRDLEIQQLEQQKAKLAQSLMDEVNKTKPGDIRLMENEIKEWIKRSEVWRTEREDLEATKNLLNDKIKELNEELERREGISMSETCLIKSLENGYKILERDMNFWKQHYFEAIGVVFELNEEIRRRENEQYAAS